MPVQRLKVAILPLDLPCSGPVTHFGKILRTGKTHGKKPDRFSLNDDIDVEKVSHLNMQPGMLEGWERKKKKWTILNENNIKVSVIIESKKRTS